MIETTVKTPQITENGSMTILEIMGQINFFDGIVRKVKCLKFGEIYKLGLGKNGFFLSPGYELELPSKIYDFEQDFRNQVLKTLRSPESDMNIGVLLEGNKGGGKSVIAKQLALESGLPIILISNPIPKEYDFSDYLKNIKQDHVLLIDEFEKIFSSRNDLDDKNHSQESFLSFLNGTGSLRNKRLVIFTSNTELNDLFHNRPGRIRYHKKFNFMPKEVFDAILDDKLEYPEFKNDLLENVTLGSCTVDILTSIIQEINIQGKPYSSFKSFFNNKDKETLYSKHKKTADGWKYVDDVLLKREIGVDKNDVKNLLIGGSQMSIIQNDESCTIYEINEYIEDENGEDSIQKVTYKLTKLKLIKPSLTF